MLTALLSIIDRLIKLREYRNERVQKVFDKVLEPIFNDLLLVHRDYIQMFQKARELLPERNYGPAKFNQSLREAAEYLRQRRIEFEPARVQLRTMVREIRGTAGNSRKVSFGAEADAFVDAVVKYFEGSKGTTYVPATTDGATPTSRFTFDVAGDAKVILGDDGPDNEICSMSTSMVREIDDLVCEPISGLDPSLEKYLPLDAIKFDEGKSAYVLFGNKMPVHEQVDTALQDRMNQLREKWSPVCETFAELKISVMSRG